MECSELEFNRAHARTPCIYTSYNAYISCQLMHMIKFIYYGCQTPEDLPPGWLDHMVGTIPTINFIKQEERASDWSA